MTESEREHKEFVSAAAAVYAWMSAADGEISQSEISGFVEYLNSLEYVDELSDTDFKEFYMDLFSVFENDYDEGLTKVQSRIKSFNGDLKKCEDLIRVARKALVADGRLSEAEEVVLQQISSLLGIVEESTI